MKIQSFTFNPFAENTYILYDETGSCVIIDPGCISSAEEQVIEEFVSTHQLKPVFLLNTHCHLDHVFGNKWVHERYGIPLIIHADELPVLQAVPTVATMYGIPCVPSPNPDQFFDLDKGIDFGNTHLEVYFTPGHAPGHVSLYHAPSKNLICGDVLFNGSIGRTDLPGGDYDTLIASIENELMVLDDDVQVFCGHGPSTTIGHERRTNPFLI